MGVTVLDERKFLADLRKQNEEAFLKAVTRYDDQVAPSMRARGYKLKNRSARTVAFIFGEICFERNRWYKKGTCKVPVDEWLGLEKHSRFSMELIYQINQISTCTTYRKTADLIEFMTGINLTKDTVLKAVKRAAALKKNMTSCLFRKLQRKTKKALRGSTLKVMESGSKHDLNKERKPNIAISLIMSSIQEASRSASPNAGS